MSNKNNLVVKLLLFVSVLLVLSGCAVQSPRMRQGLDLYKAGKYDESVQNFQEMLKRHPENLEIRSMLFRSQLNSYYYHLARARSLRGANKREEAMKEYGVALAVFPDNKRLQAEVDIYAGRRREEREPEFRTTIVPPVRLKVDPTEKFSLKLRSTPIMKIFKVIGKSFNVNFIFDKDFRDFVYTIEIENVGFYQILNQLCMIGNVKYRVIDESSILIFPDTTFKRRTFTLRGIKVFYLSNARAEDVKKLIMTVFREQQILVQEDKNSNSLIVKADDGTLVEIERFIKKIDREKSEVEIDIDIIEVNRNFLNKIGATFGSTLFTLSPGADDSTGTINSTIELGELKNTNFYLTLPSVALNFLESNDNSKIISKPNLRGVHDEDIKFKVGDEVPLPQTQFQPIAAGGIGTSPVTTYSYKSVGVQIKITPFIHNNKEVTLKTKLTINFLSGYKDNFPIFGERELENVIRLREGETNIIGGFIKDEARRSLNGLPALAKLPLLGKLFGNTEKDIHQTDLIFAITPRIVRHVELSKFDLDTIWSNTKTEGQGAARLEERIPGEDRPRKPSGSSISISPSKKRVGVNRNSIFSIRLSSSEEMSSLSINGSISNGKSTIEELRTDFFKSDKVKVLKSFSGDSFDLGYSFVGSSPKNNILAQLNIKFLEKGQYTIRINSANAYSRDRKQLKISTSSAEVEVY